MRIFDQGQGLGGVGHINYLLDPQSHQGYEPQVVYGNAEITKSIISTMPSRRKHSYVAGVIAFKDDEQLTEQQQHSLIHRFMDTFAPSHQDGKINFLFVRHQDKGNLELHFVCPRTLLNSKGFGRAFNLHPPGKSNQLFFESFTRLENYRLGFDQVDSKKMTTKDVVFYQKVFDDLKQKRSDYLSNLDFPKKFVSTNRNGGKQYGKESNTTYGKRLAHKSHFGNGDLFKQSQQQSIFGRAFKQSSATSANSSHEFNHKNSQAVTGHQRGYGKNECHSYSSFKEIGRTSWEQFRRGFGRSDNRTNTGRRLSTSGYPQTQGLNINEELRVLGMALIDCEFNEMPAIQARINQLMRVRQELECEPKKIKIK
ncbi:relaxase/mobilization nuclease domain-containing protein [Polynucleobacter sp. MWH-CaK5]|uniref:relaxase/mobilization nuclease domain-containing protein n=1 Tax=Polynucleobacter sp. MWH-CaK5 TaxID=2689107 RepID=UPI001BFDD166|nr:relaxase/mobilization nuclease domain-containing protein [Polynucleobacter sp. MWH-CaK5]